MVERYKPSLSKRLSRFQASDKDFTTDNGVRTDIDLKDLYIRCVSKFTFGLLLDYDR